MHDIRHYLINSPLSGAEDQRIEDVCARTGCHLRGRFPSVTVVEEGQGAKQKRKKTRRKRTKKLQSRSQTARSPTGLAPAVATLSAATQNLAVFLKTRADLHSTTPTPTPHQHHRHIRHEYYRPGRRIRQYQSARRFRRLRMYRVAREVPS